MKRIKIISIMLIVCMLAAIPVSAAFAASGASTLGTGTVQSISLVTDSGTGITTVSVTILDDGGLVQNLQISLETAVTQGLVTPAVVDSTGVVLSDPAATGIVATVALVTDTTSGATSVLVTFDDATTASLNLSDAYRLGLITLTVNDAAIGTPVVIDPTLISTSTTYSKAVTRLGMFFNGTLGLTYDQLAAYAADGYGYGVIAQASWMATQLGGDATLLDQILAAKSSGDFSTIVLPDGTTATNWGQLRKAVLTDPHQNLGGIMSGKAAPLVPPTTTTTTTTTTAPTTTSQGNGNGNANGNANTNGSTNGNANANGSASGTTNTNGSTNGNANGNGNSNGTTNTNGNSNGNGNANGSTKENNGNGKK
jgi:hypothetical protein